MRLKSKRDKRGNGTAQDAKAPISLTPVQQVQGRITTYEQALQERAVSIDEAKGQVDRLTAEILQIRGALGEAMEMLVMLNPDGDEVVMPPEPAEVEAKV